MALRWEAPVVISCNLDWTEVMAENAVVFGASDSDIWIG